MKYIYFSATLVVGLLVLLSSCGHEHGEGTHTHDDHAHGDETHAPHEPELAPFAFTIWTKNQNSLLNFHR